MSRKILFSVVSLLTFFAFAQPLSAQPPDMQVILDDFGLSTADLMILGGRISERMEELQGKFENRFNEPPTKENYREKVGEMLDEIGPAITGILQGEVKDFLTPDQYQKLETRALQAHISMLRGIEESEDAETLFGNLPAGMLQMAIGPHSVLEFTETQKQQLLELQKRTILESVGAGLDIQEEYPDGTGSLEEVTGVVVKKFRPIALRFKREYEKILTDKQKALIEGMMDDMPDYLWNMMPQNRGKEREWRPGADSWKPGDGAPGENADREARPERPHEGPRFPGSE